YALLSRPGAGALADAEAREAAINFYDNGVFQFDYYVGEVLDQLKSKGYLENALVVITADHGEALGDHGEFGHAKGVWFPVQHVPLIMLRFGYEPPSAIEQPAMASQIDIAPTILHELGM